MRIMLSRYIPDGEGHPESLSVTCRLFIIANGSQDIEALNILVINNIFARLVKRAIIRAGRIYFMQYFW